MRNQGNKLIIRMNEIMRNIFSIRSKLVRGWPFAFVIAATFILHASGVFRPIDGFFFDIVQKIDVTPPPASTLLVEESPTAIAHQGDDGHWLAVVTALRGLGARQVIFTFNPGDIVAQDVILGRHARMARGGNWIIAEPPVTAAAAWGAMMIPPAEYGIHRRQLTTIAVDGQSVPTLSFLAASRQTSGESSLPTPGTAYLVRFPRSLEDIPRVDAERVLDGRVPRALVAGRSAVVALGTKAGQLGIATPVTPDAPLTTPAEFTVLALETLLSGRAVNEAGLVTTALLLLLFGGSGQLLYSQLGPRHGPSAVLAVIACVPLVGFVAVLLMDTLLPVSALLVSQALVSMWLWRGSELSGEQDLALLRREVSTWVHKGASPSEERDRWPALAAMTARLLGLHRSIFLTAAANGGVEQTAAVGCSLSDISADMRNPARPPYSLATREGAPVAIGNGFLTSAGPNEDVYLAPLPSADGTVRTWWAFTLERDDVPRTRSLLAAVRGASEQIADLAYDPAAAGADAKALNAELWRDFRYLGGRAAMLEGVVDELSTAVVIFDPLGRVLHTNSRMASIMALGGFTTGMLAPSDIFTVLGGLPQEQSARLVRQVLLEREPVGLPAAHELAGRRYFLRFSVPRGQADGDGRGALPLALICEVLDITEVARMAAFQRDFSSQFGLNLRNQFGAMMLIPGLLADPRLSETARARVLDRLRATVERARDNLASVGSYFKRELGGVNPDAYPVDPLASLHAVSEEATREAAQRNVQLESGCASPLGLRLWRLPERLDAVSARDCCCSWCRTRVGAAPSSSR